MGTRIPSLRGELGLLPSLWLDVSSFWEVDCKEATFVGGIDWDATGPGWESCFELLERKRVRPLATVEVRIGTDRSTRRAYSSIFMRRMRSTLIFSKERRSPSKRAMRACKNIRI
jgi:hypothetical protein